MYLLANINEVPSLHIRTFTRPKTLKESKARDLPYTSITKLHKKKRYGLIFRHRNPYHSYPLLAYNSEYFMSIGSA